VEVIHHVPVVRPRRTGNHGAALHILAVHPARTPPDIGTDRCSRHGTTRRRDVLPATAADLMPKDAADDRANDRAWYVRRLGGLDDLLTLNPALLLRRTDHYPNGMHRNLEQMLVRAPTIVVRQRGRRRRAVRILRPPVDGPRGRNAVVESHRGQRWI